MDAKKRNFVTVFLNATNVHCSKDVGMIPRTFSDRFGFKSYLVCKDNGEFEQFDNLDIIKLGINKIWAEIRLVFFIVKNAKKIDLLNLYHWGRHSLYIGRLYKLFNKDGYLYVKCDMDDRGVSVLKNNKRARKTFNKILECADLMSCESSRIRDELNSLFNYKIEWIPNGVEIVMNNYKTHKEKIILTVGRLGTEQKATENLVDAFVKICHRIPEWDLLLVGDTTEKFEEYIDNVLYNNGLKGRIICTGNVSDREKLINMYEKSAIFALPSRWEGFALVMLEALQCGCYFIGTDGIAPIKDVVTEEYIGSVVEIDNVQQLADTILDVIETNKFLDDRFAEARTEYVEKNFSWEEVCNKIYSIYKEDMIGNGIEN